MRIQQLIYTASIALMLSACSKEAKISLETAKVEVGEISESVCRLQLSGDQGPAFG